MAGFGILMCSKDTPVADLVGLTELSFLESEILCGMNISYPSNYLLFMASLATSLYVAELCFECERAPRNELVD